MNLILMEGAYALLVSKYPKLVVLDVFLRLKTLTVVLSNSETQKLMNARPVL
jgi:hypothetical protein